MTLFTKSKMAEIKIHELKGLLDTTIKLPLFQRSLVWSEGRFVALWDSILRMFPLPLFLVYKGTGERRNFQTSSNPIHGETFEKQGDYYDILDGQQRIVAIESVLNYNSKSTNRVWVDLAPTNKHHPFRFKFWLYNCTKVFPFGFDVSADGEHDFAALPDRDINMIWDEMQNVETMKNKEFYKISLDETFPWKASCPVPLDELIKIENGTREDTMNSIKKKRNEIVKNENIFTDRQRDEPDEGVVEKLAAALIKLKEYTVTFQLVDISDPYDAMTYIQRIGRGGIQISTRQLAVSKIMHLLGKEGNSAIASFQSSPALNGRLDMEDVIHAASRMAVFDTLSEENKTSDSDNDKLIDLSLDTLKQIQIDQANGAKILEKLKKLCSEENDNKSSKTTRIQSIFELLYNELRYDEKRNEKGFSLVQLVQSRRINGGIAPITLHPLLYWIWKSNNDQEIENEQRHNMVRWLLLANGFIEKPAHKLLNTHLLCHVAQKNNIDISDVVSSIKELLEQHENNEKLYKDLGILFQIPGQNGELRTHGKAFPDFFQPDFISEITLRRLMFQNWPKSMMNNVFLMWHQRRFLEVLYGNTDHIPALFSKGKPFDADHIVPRNRLINKFSRGITTKDVQEVVMSVVKELELMSDFDGEIKLTFNEDCFRRHFPNMTANFRFWPRVLNRSDQDDTVSEKFNFKNIEKVLKKHPLKDKFKNEESLWEYSLILEDEQKKLWSALPPSLKMGWGKESIGKFFQAVITRDVELYKKVYKFVFNDKHSNGEDVYN
jgi:hypothetical protein